MFVMPHQVVSYHYTLHFITWHVILQWCVEEQCVSDPRAPAADGMLMLKYNPLCYLELHAEDT